MPHAAAKSSHTDPQKCNRSTDESETAPRAAECAPPAAKISVSFGPARISAFAIACNRPGSPRAAANYATHEMPKCKGPDALDDEPKTKPKNGLKATEPDLPKTASAPQTTALAARPPPEPCMLDAFEMHANRKSLAGLAAEISQPRCVRACVLPSWRRCSGGA